MKMSYWFIKLYNTFNKLIINVFFNYFFQTLKAKLTIVADGCFSKLRKSLVYNIPNQKSTFVGLLLNDCPQIKPKFAELILTDSSPVLVYRISEHLTRLFVDIRDKKVPRNLRKYLEDVIYHQLPGL